MGDDYSSWACDGCGAANSLEDELGLCRTCGQLASAGSSHDPESPPRGVEYAEGAESGGDYRTESSQSEALLRVEQRRIRVGAATAGPVVIVLGLAARMALGTPADSETYQAVDLGTLLLIVGLLAGGGILASALWPRVTTTEVAVGESSLVFGPEGVPASKHNRLPIELLSRTVAQCESPASRDEDLRFEVVALDHEGGAQKVVGGLADADTARWIADELERRVLTRR